jgi:CyaY protein
MTDPEFLNVAEQLLRTIEVTCDTINDDSEADIDNQRVGNMVTLTFANRSQIVINLQKPLHEVWMASPSGGYHYRYTDGRWQDTKGEADFYSALTRDASTLAGQAIVFCAD